MLNPHGSKLINQLLTANQSKQILNTQNQLPKLVLNNEQIKEVKNIALGVYSPLTGFLREKDFKNVVINMRLANGTVWPIPIVHDISEEKYHQIKNKKDLILKDSQNKTIALLKNIEIYRYDKKHFARNVYKTLDKNHPAVNDIYKMNKYLIGGDIELLNYKEELFPEYNFTPKKTRQTFQGRGWNRIVAFQTRNVPHRGHEFLQKEALKQTDGLFVQPVIGEKKLEDFKDEYILSSYETLIDKYYPKNKVVLGILPLKMRYAGPREAVFHAIIRKNYGCSHFIVGRDHAGVGDYYPPFAAQEIFDQFKKDEIGIEILKYPEVVYDKKKNIHVFIDQCPPKNQISFSGTKLREYVKNRQTPPTYLIRPEVYNILTNTKNSLVDQMYKNNTNNHKGCVLWFTGLSQSGKSVTADKVYDILKEKGLKVERLDGDIVREALTRDLGFSKKDRDENIRRVGFVANLLSRNGVIVIASFISPYKKQRDNLRIKINNFIEIFANTPLEVCEKRDKKGLYAKARKGEIANFTGISDPFEQPKNPEIELKPAEYSIEKCAKEVIQYLSDKKLIN